LSVKIKRMKLFKIILLLSFVVFFSNINAQTAQTGEVKKVEQKPSSRTSPAMTRERLIAEHRQHKIAQYNAARGRQYELLVHSDEYMGKSKDLEEIFIVGKIPGDFPKYMAAQTAKDYSDVANKYFREHKEYLKDEWKIKIDNNETIIQ